MSIQTIEELRDKRSKLLDTVQERRDAAETEQRDLSEEEVASSTTDLDEVEKIDARIAAEERQGKHLVPRGEQRDLVPATEARHARAKDPDSEEKIYRPDNFRNANFWADMLESRSGAVNARERLVRNNEQALEHYESKGFVDTRAMGTGSTAGGDFLPPLYLADLWVHPLMAGRPLADRLPKYPLPADGISISIPRLSSGVSVAARDTGGSVSTTDGVTASITHQVQEYAGLVDIDRIAVMRSDPGLQTVLTQTLVRRYNVALDTDLISGSGSTPHHFGIDNLGTGLNTITWTQGSPTPALFLSQVYKAISEIDTTRLEMSPDIIVMHGRRMSWGAQPNAATFPLFQQSGLFHVAGTQDGGFISTIGGLEVVKDNNVTTTAGATTSQDKVYVLVSSDFLLAEGPLYARVHEDVGSGTGTIRFAVFAHSAFLSKRYPQGACVISGTGLIAPAFDS